MYAWNITHISTGLTIGCCFKGRRTSSRNAVWNKTRLLIRII